MVRNWDPIVRRTGLHQRVRTPLSWARVRLLIIAPLAIAFLCDASVPDTAAVSSEQGLAGSVDEDAIRAVLYEVNPTLDQRTLNRIAAAIIRFSEEYALDPGLVTAVIRVESTARPWVRSPKGAMGLMQVMPHMMEPMQLAGNAASIESNIQAGCAILAGNIRRLGEDRGISAYFWGSSIRGVAYLEKVREARYALLGPRVSS
jgi:soluble lytic murein transglycosylase-like protein